MTEFAESLSCAAPRTIHTIGHSTRTTDAFIELLNNHAIEMLIDVRRWPMSRRHPHFHRDALSAALAEKGIGYLWRQDLGGFRKANADSPNTGWRVATFRAYADFMLSAPFEIIVKEIEAIAADKRISLMCAEAVPWRCHRQLLADAFLIRDWSVRHIMENGFHAHQLTPFARPEGNRILYPGLV